MFPKLEQSSTPQYLTPSLHRSLKDKLVLHQGSRAQGYALQVQVLQGADHVSGDAFGGVVLHNEAFVALLDHTYDEAKVGRIGMRQAHFSLSAICSNILIY